MGATKYTTGYQLQIFFVIKCIETFEVTLTIHLAYPFVIVVCEIPRSFERSSPSNFRTQGSFIHINSGKIFERDLLSSDSVAKSATQKPWVF